MPENMQQSKTDEDEAAGIASALVRARRERSLTQAELADRSGVSRSAIKGYETGRTMPGSRELKALCITLGVSPTELLYGSEQAFASESGKGPGKHSPMSGMKLKWQLDALVKLLPDDEVGALLHLVRAIVVARSGVEVADERLAIVANGFAHLEGPKGPQARAALNRFVDALDAEDDTAAGEIDAMTAEVRAGKLSQNP